MINVPKNDASETRNAIMPVFKGGRRRSLAPKGWIMKRR